MKLRICILALVPIIVGCATSGDGFTLYRTTPGNDAARIHVASFDTAEGDAYNDANCWIAAKLFNAQPGVGTRFWCEKGRYRR